MPTPVRDLRDEEPEDFDPDEADDFDGLVGDSVLCGPALSVTSLPKQHVPRRVHPEEAKIISATWGRIGQISPLIFFILAVKSARIRL